MATITLLEHQRQGELGIHYLLHALAERWRSAGHRVLIHRGADAPPPADLAVLHVDLTVIPPEYQALLRAYPRVLNAATLDISKTRYSQLQLKRGDAWSGAVIVKTVANFGGMIDRALSAPENAPATLRGYPVYPSLRQMPDACWTLPGLMVERFLPERDERGYYLRIWSFLGVRERSSRYRALVPVIKSEDVLEREEVEVPQELRAWRQRLGFDFGKFDYVMHDGKPLLLDANRTPSAPAKVLDADMSASFDQLALGITEYL